MGSFLRSSDYELSSDGWSWLLGQNVTSKTKCHEIKQSLITWMKFRTNNQDFEMNVLDIPKDTSSIYVQNVPFDTLGDLLIDNIVDWWTWFKSVSNNILKNMVPFAVALAVILVVILCWPVLSSTTKLVGATIGVANQRIKPKQKKKKRSKK
ncbi:MAG: hypothetical protein WCR67_01745 [Bacilli bacterium]